IGSNDQQVTYYKAFASPPVNTEAQKSVTEDYLKQILEAYNKAPYVSQWLDTVLGQNVGNALNVAVVDMLAGKSTPKQLIASANQAGAKG
ncbi:MAG: sugar ABC transporter substrate-binding protein, partial [Microbacterium sp.]|nr:sugar ABC transporter substrate-binding protein [Microbacterium sp.]